MSLSAIILAAGKGTRMKSDLAKVLHEVCGRPMVAWVMDACREAGCEELMLVVGHKAALVRQTLGEDPDVVWVEQKEQLGTGHAVMMCREALSKLTGAVLVVAGDGPLIRGETLGKLIATHEAEGSSCTLATSILPEAGSYGRILRGPDGALLGIVEAKDADAEQLEIREVNVSLYCFDAQDLLGALEHLGNDNAKGEYYLTDVLAILRSQGKKLAAVAAVEPEDTLSINTLEQLAQVDGLLRSRLEKEFGA
jgi:bifunctional UDP-N-acetylglucosamine pyrophosphorylase/glucosamine-1-phosphate N-acetyltransferase